MKCWHCDEELIWGGDHDIEEENEEYEPQDGGIAPNPVWVG